MSYPTFGHLPDGSSIDTFRYLRDFADFLAKEKIRFKDGFQKQAMLRKLYHDIFGINDLGRGGSPLELVRMQSKQGHARSGPVEHLIERYRIAGVYEVYHIDLGDFLELDYPTGMWILKSSQILYDKIELAKGKSMDELIKSMK